MDEVWKVLPNELKWLIIDNLSYHTKIFLCKYLSKIYGNKKIDVSTVTEIRYIPLNIVFKNPFRGHDYNGTVINFAHNYDYEIFTGIHFVKAGKNKEIKEIRVCQIVNKYSGYNLCHKSWTKLWCSLDRDTIDDMNESLNIRLSNKF